MLTLVRVYIQKTCFTYPLIAILYVCTDHSSDTEYLPQRGRQAREGRGRTGFATNADQEEQNERPLSTELRGVGGRGRGRGRKEVTVPAPNNAHSGEIVQSFYVMCGKPNKVHNVYTYIHKTVDLLCYVPSAELNSRVKESSLEAEFLPARRSTRQRVPPLNVSTEQQLYIATIPSSLKLC